MKFLKIATDKIGKTSRLRNPESGFVLLILISNRSIDKDGR